MDIRVSLRVSRLILQILKLTIMEAFKNPKIYKI